MKIIPEGFGLLGGVQSIEMRFILAFGGFDDGVSGKRVFDLMDHADTFVLNFSRSLADKIVEFRKAHCLKLFLSYLLSKHSFDIYLISIN